MHLDQSALGILRKAEDKNGRKYMDWRIPYMDQLGLIMVYKSDSRYEKYMIYFFTSPASKCPGKYLHTTYGSIQVEDGSLTIRTKNRIKAKTRTTKTRTTRIRTISRIRTIRTR